MLSSIFPNCYWAILSTIRKCYRASLKSVTERRCRPLLSVVTDRYWAILRIITKCYWAILSTVRNCSWASSQNVIERRWAQLWYWASLQTVVEHNHKTVIAHNYDIEHRYKLVIGQTCFWHMGTTQDPFVCQAPISTLSCCISNNQRFLTLSWGAYVHPQRFQARCLSSV